MTIKKSKFCNNGIGIVPNALDSEKFPPPEYNAIKDNEVFWNNFNFYLGAPFQIPSATQAASSRRSAPASCCSAAVTPSSRTTGSTATTPRASR